ncbi:MAG: heterodisulfide reductase-related iron-sulfur binding cluster [Eggerthella sp.]|nr:heterodisulfide reductase-related iron-sulfur binding cluster [Eggerthella sp.]
MDAATPSREALWNIEGSWLVYPCFLLVLAVAAYFFWRRYRLWKIGRPLERGDRPLERLKGAFADALLQATVVKERGVGLAHLGMYVGMAVMVVATASYAVQVDLGLDIAKGDYYLYVLALGTDIAGLAFCIAMVACIVRRAAGRNPSLETKPADIVVLAWLLVIGVTGFVVEGLRIVGTNDPWAAWSPIGNLFAPLFAGLSAAQVSTAHQVLWWFHMAIAFGILAYWMYSKLVHVLLVPATVYCRPLEPKGTLSYVDLEDEELEEFGVGKLEDFTWKDLLDAEACVRCGRCETVCPAYGSGKPLSPKDLMQALDAHLGERGPLVRAERHAEAAGGAFEPTEEQRAVLDKALVGDVVAPEALWSCTTCGACMEACPALLEHVPKVVGMRTYQVSMESAFPSEAKAAFRNLETNGNPWGLGWQSRMAWAEGLDVPTLADCPQAEYVYWPGCSGAYDARNRKVSRALVALLRHAGVDFAVIGPEEKCCGDAARRMGNEFLYYQLATENIETLNAYGAKKIIVQCPHCAQALERDYPQLGGRFEVVRHAQLLERLVAEGRLPGAERAGAQAAFERVTYHDSCYLGRYADVYDEPRAVVKACGAQVVEMERTREKSFCCGAGGGRMWLEEREGRRMNVLRAEQARDTGADAVATACPFCLSMLEDGLASQDDALPVRDIAELLSDALALSR